MIIDEFSHGGGIEKFSQELGCKKEEVIDLSSNINFIKPKIDIDFNSLDISAYPVYEKLYESIAQNYNISTTQLELFNGGSSGIFTLFNHLNLSVCSIYSPAYLEYKKAGKKMGYTIELINRLGEMKTPQEGSLVVFVNPSTPDGSYYEMEELLRSWQSLNCTVLIDESFLDFTDSQSVIKYLSKYPKLYILKSMTKFYSSAGIRVGCIISNEDNIENLSKKEPMWKISQFDSTYLQEAFKDSEFKTFAKEENKKNRVVLKKVLESSSLIKKVYESIANYFLVELDTLEAKEFQELLLPYKILIRDCSNFDFLDERYVRIAVKDLNAIKTLQRALSEIEKL